MKRQVVSYLTGHWKVSCAARAASSRNRPARTGTRAARIPETICASACARLRRPGCATDTREALAVEAGTRLRGDHVVDVLNRLARLYGAPRFVFVDNGSEFTGRLMDMWAYHHGVRLDFSRPGKPADKGFVKSFNGSLRDECLNLHWFATVTEARGILEAWRRDYNESRPHSSLGDRTPAEFARSIKEMGPA